MTPRIGSSNMTISSRMPSMKASACACGKSVPPVDGARFRAPGVTDSIEVSTSSVYFRERVMVGIMSTLIPRSPGRDGAARDLDNAVADQKGPRHPTASLDRADAVGRSASLRHPLRWTTRFVFSLPDPRGATASSWRSRRQLRLSHSPLRATSTPAIPASR